MKDKEKLLFGTPSKMAPLTREERKILKLEEETRSDMLKNLFDYHDPLYYEITWGVNRNIAEKVGKEAWGGVNDITYIRLADKRPLLYHQIKAATIMGDSFLDTDFVDISRNPMESEDEYLDRFYEANRKKIDKVIKDIISEGAEGNIDIIINADDNKALFKNTVRERMTQKNITDVEEGLKSSVNSEVFTSAEARGKHNIVIAIQNDEEALSKVHELLEELGKPFDISKLKYDKKGKKYVYDNIFTIDTDDSPKDGTGGGINIQKLKKKK